MNIIWDHSIEYIVLGLSHCQTCMFEIITHNLENWTEVAVTLTDVPMGCKSTVAIVTGFVWTPLPQQIIYIYIYTHFIYILYTYYMYT